MSAQPRYFGKEGHRAFGWLHLPDHAPRGTGVVLCPPLGYEAVLAHRPLRHLAERLCARGSAVLRLDYHGTGDAEGLDEDPRRLDAWLDSIDAAVDQLRATGAGRIVLYGLRAGALLAAASAQRRSVSPIDGLILHAAPPSGRTFARELRAFRRLAAISGLDTGETQRLDPRAEEAAGFVLWGEAVDALSAIDLTKFDAPPAAAALFLPREDLPADEPIARHFTALGVALERLEVGGYAEMMQDPHKSIVPNAAWAALETWLESRPGLPCAPVPTAHTESLTAIVPPRIDADRVRSEDGPRVRETPLRFGPENRLFAILTEPESTAPTRTALLLLNAGSIHRIGANRMHVLWARAWAARGHRVLRLDIGGIGDSTAAPGLPENQTYSQSAVADVEAALAELERRGAGRAVLLGLCSGAYVAFHTARVASVIGAVLINPQTFDYREGDPLDVATARNASDATYYRRAILSKEKWKKLASGEVNLARVAQVVWTRTRSVAATRLTNLVRRLRGGEAAEGALGREIRRVAGATQLAFIYSVGDPGLDYLDRHAGEAMRRLRGERRLTFDLVDRADHTFTPPDSQRRLFALISAKLEALG